MSTTDDLYKWVLRGGDGFRFSPRNDILRKQEYSQDAFRDLPPLLTIQDPATLLSVVVTKGTVWFGDIKLAFATAALAIPASTTDYSVYLELDDSANPTTITLAGAATFPATARQFELAHVTTSAGRITQATLYWKGGDLLWPSFNQYVVVKITDTATGGGKYLGLVCTGTVSPEHSGANEALPEGMTVGDEDVVIINADEDGQPTHWIKLNTYATGIVVGMSNDDPPQRVVLIQRGFYRIDSPQVLASGTGDAAQTDTWNRTIVTSGTNYGDVPVAMPITSRPVYNSAGSSILFKMVRYAYFAADGRLDRVTAENRVMVDEPEDCP